MGMVNAVNNRLQDSKNVVELIEHDDALKEAARLADLYSDVKPEPYAVPIERFVGLPILGETNLLKD